MSKIDFTVKGTKFPKVPDNTRVSTVNEVKKNLPFTSSVSDFPNNIVSYGVIEIGNVICIKADKPGYTGKNHLVFYLSDIDRLAQEQGMCSESKKEVFKEEKKKSKYHKEIKPGVIIDVYDVLDAYQVESSAVQHAIKKLLMPGERGSKSMIQDLEEAKQSIERAIEKYTNQSKFTNEK